MLNLSIMKNISLTFQNKKVKIMLVGIFVLTPLFTFSMPARADETQVNQQITDFQNQLSSELSQVNDIYGQASDSQQKLEDTQKKIDGLQVKINQSQAQYTSLQDTVSHQMRDLQTNRGTAMTVIDLIFSSNSLSEAITRVTSFQVVMNAETKQSDELVNTKNSLTKMKSDLEKSKTDLVTNQSTFQSQQDQLQSNIASLQAKIADNQQLLAEMQGQAANSTNKTNVNGSSDGKGQNASGPMLGGQGTVLICKATAYSSDGGLGYITATGINLHENPMCIAVDPSVIPLGSMVEVQGYGIAVAGDTGSAIIGNHIDVHFPHLAQAQAWGLKYVQVKILS